MDAVTAWLLAALAAGLQDRTEQERQVRAEIAEKIRTRAEAKQAATLGLLQEAVNLSIGYGAPVYNAGEHEAGYRFYAETSRALLEAFGKEEAATERARRALAILRAGLEAAEKEATIQEKAWAIRYSFDRLIVESDHLALYGLGLISLGNEYFRGSRPAAAADAYREAAGLLGELTGSDAAKVNEACRLAPLMLAHALFAQKKFEEASAALGEAVRYLPALPGLSLNRRTQHPDPEEYDRLLEALEARVKKEPGSAALEFLLGYELFFGEQREDALEHLRKALKADPKHAAARVFLKQFKNELDSDF
jgi:tetratricopeptide (TPR) repeat protein